MSAVTEEPSPPDRRFVVAGEDGLAYRLAHELMHQFDGRVTVVCRRGSPRMTRLPGIELVDAPSDPDRLAQVLSATVAGATALALLSPDDRLNIDAALRVAEEHPELRIVMRMSDLSLARGVRSLLPNATVISDITLAAPLFAAAILGVEQGQEPRAIAGRTVQAVGRPQVKADDVICGLAIVGDDEPETLPEDEGRANLVLAEVRAVRRPRPRRSAYRIALAIMLRRLWVVVGVLATVTALGAVTLAVVERIGWWDALYLSILSMRAGIDPDLGASAAEQVVQVVLTLVSVATVPVATIVVADAVVRVRLALSTGTPAEYMRGHVIVSSAGYLGRAVVRQLHASGVDVVLVDRSEQSASARLAQELRIPLVIGDITDEHTLLEAGIERCQTLALLGSEEESNLAAGIRARALRPEVRLMLRVFDADTAQRLGRALDITVTRSSSFLAAPTFAAAMLDQPVLHTVAAGRRLLVIAEVEVGAGSEADGLKAGAIEQPHLLRVLAVTSPTGATRWRPPPGDELHGSDKVVVVSTRSGLSKLLYQVTS
jgi:Trk K+ transport system NAD-binding subunit